MKDTPATAQRDLRGYTPGGTDKETRTGSDITARAVALRLKASDSGAVRAVSTNTAFSPYSPGRAEVLSRVIVGRRIANRRVEFIGLIDAQVWLRATTRSGSDLWAPSLLDNCALPTQQVHGAMSPHGARWRGHRHNNRDYVPRQGGPNFGRSRWYERSPRDEAHQTGNEESRRGRNDVPYTPPGPPVYRSITVDHANHGMQSLQASDGGKRAAMSQQLAANGGEASHAGAILLPHGTSGALDIGDTMSQTTQRMTGQHDGSMRGWDWTRDAKSEDMKFEGRSTVRPERVVDDPSPDVRHSDSLLQRDLRPEFSAECYGVGRQRRPSSLIGTMSNALAPVSAACRQRSATPPSEASTVPCTPKAKFSPISMLASRDEELCHDTQELDRAQKGRVRLRTTAPDAARRQDRTQGGGRRQSSGTESELYRSAAHHHDEGHGQAGISLFHCGQAVLRSSQSSGRIPSASRQVATQQDSPNSEVVGDADSALDHSAGRPEDVARRHEVLQCIRLAISTQRFASRLSADAQKQNSRLILESNRKLSKSIRACDRWAQHVDADTGCPSAKAARAAIAAQLRHQLQEARAERNDAEHCYARVLAAWRSETAMLQRDYVQSIEHLSSDATLANTNTASSRGTRRNPPGFEIRDLFSPLHPAAHIINLARIPPLLTEPLARRLLRWDDRNALVESPSIYYNLADVEMRGQWPADEHRVFLRRYKESPKQFGVIAAGLANRSAEDCVLHYYMTKSQIDYRRDGRPRSRGLVRQRGRARKIISQAPVRSLRRPQTDADMVSSEDTSGSGEEETAVQVPRKRKKPSEIVEVVHKEADAEPGRSRSARSRKVVSRPHDVLSTTAVRDVRQPAPGLTTSFRIAPVTPLDFPGTGDLDVRSTGPDGSLGRSGLIARSSIAESTAGAARIHQSSVSTSRRVIQPLPSAVAMPAMYRGASDEPMVLAKSPSRALTSHAASRTRLGHDTTGSAARITKLGRGGDGGAEVSSMSAHVGQEPSAAQHNELHTNLLLDSDVRLTSRPFAARSPFPPVDHAVSTSFRSTSVSELPNSTIIPRYAAARRDVGANDRSAKDTAADSRARHVSEFASDDGPVVTAGTAIHPPNSQTPTNDGRNIRPYARTSISSLLNPT